MLQLRENVSVFWSWINVNFKYHNNDNFKNQALKNHIGQPEYRRGCVCFNGKKAWLDLKQCHLIIKQWGLIKAKSECDYSHHRLQLWSVDTVCAGPHPRKEGNPPAEYTRLHLARAHTLWTLIPKEAEFFNLIIHKHGQTNQTFRETILPQAQISTGLP